MAEVISWVMNTMPKTSDQKRFIMSKEELSKVHDFHKSFPQYKVTPLAKLDQMAKKLGISQLFVKDESYRFGLNAFKVLGGSYAIGKYIAKLCHQDISFIPYSKLISKELKQQLGTLTFFTATDGNHGRGVAWSARQLGQNAVVYMPKGTTATRLEHIKNEGATVTIEDANYDECVRMASLAARENVGGVVVQDTAWDGYEEIPSWIMQGYGTMAYEALTQLHDYHCEKPTHVFCQAGVGSLAGAVCGYFANEFPDDPPIVVIVEALAANCLYQSANAKDGSIRTVTGDMPTIMAGLACGEPNTISWDILQNHADAFVSAPDWVTEKGMRLLAYPMGDDAKVVSGESGAVTMGLLHTIMTDPNYQDLKNALSLGADSKVLLFSTEGNTDPDRYLNIVGNTTT